MMCGALSLEHAYQNALVNEAKIIDRNNKMTEVEAQHPDLAQQVRDGQLDLFEAHKVAKETIRLERKLARLAGH